MPTKLFVISEGAPTDEMVWIRNLFSPDTDVERINGTYFYCSGDVEGRAVVEYVMDGIWVYLTEINLLKQEYLDKVLIFQDYCLFNIFYLPKPYQKWSSEENGLVMFQDPFWRHVYLAPKESMKEITPEMVRRYRYGLIGMFYFSDWIFASRGGYLELVDCYSVDGGPLNKFRFDKNIKPKGIDLMAYATL
jgi:hypothetical protein